MRLFIKAAKILLAQLCLWFVDAYASSVYCSGFVGLRVVHPSPNCLRSFVCISGAANVALITVFLESLGSLHIFAILGSILSVAGSRKGMLPVSCFQLFNPPLSSKDGFR